MQQILTNAIICGDCRDKMKQHIPDDSIDLVYADPPFFSGKNYEVIWKDGAEVRSFEDTKFYTLECECGKVFPENHLYCAFCGAGKDKATERRSNDIEAYLQWLRPKLEECYRTLKPDGSLYVHLDHHAMFNVKVMLDDIFKTGGFKTAITWRRCGSKGNAKTFANNSDYILYYVKGKNFTFNIQYGEYSEVTLKMFKHDDHDDRGFYKLTDVSAPGGNGYKYDIGCGEKMPKGGYRWREDTMLEKIKDNRVIVKNGKVPAQKRYLSEGSGVPFDNVWTDIENVKSPLYPTEKPSSLLYRIIEASSNPGDTVLDCFCGCGTAILSAQKLGRRWIGIDISPTSCKLMAQRVSTLTNERGEYIGDGIGVSDIIDMPQTSDELKTMEAFEFQNWAVQQLGGRQVQRRAGDRGIDGWTFNGDPIQVKQSEKVGTPVVRLFAQDIRDVDKTHGIIVALSFGKGAYTEIAHVKAKHGIDIELKTVEEILNEGGT